MTSWPEFERLVEWPRVQAVSTLLKDTCASANLAPDKEWVLEVIKEAAEILPAAISEGQESPYLSEFILGVSAARNSLVVASYCFNFLRGEGLMDARTVERVEGQLDELEASLASLTEMLRRSLSSQRRFSSN